ncbi:winged helix-turn-helix domain-containing protein [Streptosporangium sp. NBC_01755]|uniref:winged helix-turn-helix domain-containing protein n=1 Tax=Streptosporangium sp. NBC_01755 TaxID=2975949 RepID=UPI002DD91AEA|nr:winged helix-turn-helix domain-containing protein [Streptosporangium sp. NBC_01755]WSD02615.1 winged helix-turn-helix domain-containing protein [Streptosporangium sp. NBC_01755]
MPDLDWGATRVPDGFIPNGLSVRNPRSPQTLAAGSKLALCEQHGASRNTVRQALDELKCEGLIVIRHGKGHFVQSVRD